MTASAGSTASGDALAEADGLPPEALGEAADGAAELGAADGDAAGEQAPTLSSAISARARDFLDVTILLLRCCLDGWWTGSLGSAMDAGVR
jgi:hypothetical protein